MKKWGIVLCLIILLTGCGKKQSLETVQDVYGPEPVPKAMEVLVELPGDLEQLSQSAGSSFYEGDGYTLTVQTRPAGDLTGTVRELTGFLPDQLQILENKCPEGTCYRCSWTSAGEGGSQVGRLSIIDDGNYQYVLCTMAPEQLAGDLEQSQWREIFRSFHLAEPGSVDYSGS